MPLKPKRLPALLVASKWRSADAADDHWEQLLAAGGLKD
jgi:hypothetical protein